VLLAVNFDNYLCRDATEVSNIAMQRHLPAEPVAKFAFAKDPPHPSLGFGRVTTHLAREGDQTRVVIAMEGHVA
jgi:hypothetical protein